MVRDDGFDDDDDDAFTYIYDPENRLTEVEYDDSGGALRPVAQYRYDALGRRIEYVKYDENGLNPVTTRFYHDGQNVISEFTYTEPGGVPTETLARTYVNGALYIDERVVMRDYATNPQNPQDYYYLHQELYSVAGLVRANGSLVEAYTYDTYGQARIWEFAPGDLNLDGVSADAQDLAFILDCIIGGGPASYTFADLNMDGTIDNADRIALEATGGQPIVELASSSVGNPYLFTGRPTHTLASFTHAGRTEFKRIQDNRNRIYDPKHGRWMQRDPAGYVNGFNLFQYVGSISLTMVDPYGLAATTAPASQPAKTECDRFVDILFKSFENPQHRHYMFDRLFKLYVPPRPGLAGWAVWAITPLGGTQGEIHNQLQSLSVQASNNPALMPGFQQSLGLAPEVAANLHWTFSHIAGILFAHAHGNDKAFQQFIEDLSDLRANLKGTDRYAEKCAEVAADLLAAEFYDAYYERDTTPAAAQIGGLLHPTALNFVDRFGLREKLCGKGCGLSCEEAAKALNQKLLQWSGKTWHQWTGASEFARWTEK